MDRAVLHAQGDHALADAIVHDQIQREIFDEEVGVVLQALLVERVKHGVTGTVGGGAGALDRGARAHILHVTTKRALVDRAVVVAAERHAGMFELDHRRRGLTHHIFDRVLVAEPVGTLDGIVHVPRPVIGRVVAQAGGNSALRRHGMAARREDFGDAGGLEALLGAAHRRAQARSTRADDDRVIDVIDDLIGRHQAAAPDKATLRMAKIARAAPPIA